MFEITLWITKGANSEAALTTLDRAFFAEFNDRNYRVRQELCKLVNFNRRLRLRLTAYQLARFFIQRRLDKTASCLKWDEATEIAPQPPVIDLRAFSGGGQTDVE